MTLAQNEQNSTRSENSPIKIIARLKRSKLIKIKKYKLRFRQFKRVLVTALGQIIKRKTPEGTFIARKDV